MPFATAGSEAAAAPVSGGAVAVTSRRIQAAQRRCAWITILVPFAGTAAAVALLFHRPLTIADLLLFAVFYVLTSLGITVGFHRLFAHRSFQASPGLRVTLAILGSMAAQGGLIYWVATHRRHHQFAEQDEDPHSPYVHEGRRLGRLRGIWHSHLGWMLDSRPSNTARFARDLMRDPRMVRVSDRYLLWVALGLVIPAAAGGLIAGSWMGALTGFLWGGMVRMFAAHHAMWTSGSTAHLFGTRPFDTRDASRNNGLLAVPNLGEAWHNNHHAFPSSAMFAFRFWQIDPGGWVIRASERLGWAWDVKAPTPEMIASARLRPAGGSRR